MGAVVKNDTGKERRGNQMNDIERQIQDLLERREYIQLYQEQPKVINMMLLVEDQREFEDYLADMDEDDQLEKRVCQCNQILESTGYRIQLVFDDTYYTGVYFLSVTEGE